VKPMAYANSMMSLFGWSTVTSNLPDPFEGRNLGALLCTIHKHRLNKKTKTQQATYLGYLVDYLHYFVE
jgi:hypothetical protein